MAQLKNNISAKNSLFPSLGTGILLLNPLSHPEREKKYYTCHKINLCSHTGLCTLLSRDLKGALSTNDNQIHVAGIC